MEEDSLLFFQYIYSYSPCLDTVSTRNLWTRHGVKIRENDYGNVDADTDGDSVDEHVDDNSSNDIEI